jgi:group I intron endonuclease
MSEDRRRELRRAYRERPTTAGVYQVRNTSNGKVLLGSRLNLDGALNTHRFMLTHGSHRNARLQREWNEYGADAFVFEILAVVQVKDEPGFDLGDELSLLEQLWLEELKPLGGHGYNESEQLRQV